MAAIACLVAVLSATSAEALFQRQGPPDRNQAHLPVAKYQVRCHRLRCDSPVSPADLLGLLASELLIYHAAYEQYPLHRRPPLTCLCVAKTQQYALAFA